MLAEVRLRKISRMMARPTPTSAAATVITKMAKICPPTLGVLEKGLEGDQVDVDRVEHQLDGQQHHDRVAAHQQAVDPQRKHEGTEDEELV